MAPLKRPNRRYKKAEWAHLIVLKRLCLVLLLQCFCTGFTLRSPYFHKLLASAIASTARAQQLERQSAVTICIVSFTVPQHICHGCIHSLPCISAICSHCGRNIHTKFLQTTCHWIRHLLHLLVRGACSDPSRGKLCNRFARVLQRKCHCPATALPRKT
jgi:hypothetical protein